MGVMNKMRDNMAGIMIFLVVVFVLTMSVGGLVGGANIMDVLSGNQPNAFTLVNGEEISRETFMRALQNERENFRQRNGTEPTEDQMIQITDQVWETMVSQTLIRQAVEDQDITVSEDEIRYFFTENVHPSIQQYFINEQGQFDAAAYQNAVTAPEAANFFAAMRQQVAAIVPVEKLQRKVMSAAQVSDAEVRTEFMKSNMTYDMDYFMVKASKWSTDEVEVSEEEILDYYEENLEDYQKEETRVLTFVSRSIQSTASDTTRAINLINDVKDDILAGESFESMAQIHSDGPSSTDGGYLGWFGRGKMTPPFEQAAFGAKVGEIIGPIETQFGYHLIKVEATRNNGEPEVEARHILVEVRTSETTRDNLRRELKNLEFLADEIGFEKAVDSLGIEAQTSNPLTVTDNFIFGLGSFQSAVRFAYLSDVGDHSQVYQNEDNFAIFSLVGIDAAGDRLLDDVSASIERTIVTNKKLELATQTAESLHAELKTSDDWASLADGDDGYTFMAVQGSRATNSIRGLGRYAEIFGFMESAEPGTMSGVFELPVGAVIVKLQAKSDFDDAAFQAGYDELYQGLVQTRQNELWNDFISALRDEAEIIDNRLRLL